jgi:hypothetical protein
LDSSIWSTGAYGVASLLDCRWSTGSRKHM